MNYMFLATGFEDVEALAPLDILRRCGIEIATVSIMEEKAVESAHGVKIEADIMLQDADFSKAEFLILPGGMPGASNLNDCEPLCEAIKKHFDKGGNVAAICAAPMVFGRLGILRDKEAICYPGCEKYLEGAKISESPVVRDGNVITGKGPGFAFEFGFKIAETLKGKEIADNVAKGMLLL